MLTEIEAVRNGRLITPRSFSGLMDLYEQNYLRLRKIAPDLSVADQMISTTPGHSNLYLSVNQRCKFTTMLSLTYRFGRPGHYIFEPDLHLKMYHDARVVEVEYLQSRSRGYIRNDDYLYKKWVLNRFLYKWLGFCLYQGHHFHPMKHLKRPVNSL